MSERSSTVSKADYDLCDQENTNLRRHLLWAAQRLSPAHVAELRERVKGKMIAEGGFVSEQADDDRHVAMEARRLALKLADLADALVSTPRGANLERLAARLDDTANALRGALGPEPAHTLKSFMEASGG